MAFWLGAWTKNEGKNVQLKGGEVSGKKEPCINKKKERAIAFITYATRRNVKNVGGPVKSEVADHRMRASLGLHCL